MTDQELDEIERRITAWQSPEHWPPGLAAKVLLEDGPKLLAEVKRLKGRMLVALSNIQCPTVKAELARDLMP